MHNRENCYENVWILSGTSDGPILAKKLLEHNYSVFVSVVTYKASQSYCENPKLHIITGKLNGISEIINFIEKNKIDHIIDATHPFALIISENLQKACKNIKKTVLVFERKSKINKKTNVSYISDLKDISKVNLRNKNILLAIGSRSLNEVARFYVNEGANIFTRIIPTPESISTAFSSCIKNSNIAIFEPSKKGGNLLEKTLCDFWEIDYILCRDSGSYSQINWEKVVSNSRMKLFLVERPKLEYQSSSFFSEYDTLISQITNRC